MRSRQSGCVTGSVPLAPLNTGLSLKGQAVPSPPAPPLNTTNLINVSAFVHLEINILKDEIGNAIFEKGPEND